MILQFLRRKDLGADGGVRANGHALETLNARLRVPHGNFQREIPFLILRSGGGESAIHREGADRQFIAVTAGELAEDTADELRRVDRHRRQERSGAVHLGARQADFMQMRERVIHRLQIHFHHLVALFGVGLLDGIFDGFNGLVARQHAGEGEEADLHDGVDAAAHAAVTGDFGGVDDKEFRLFLDQRFLHGRGQLRPDLVRRVRRIEQERAAGHQAVQHRVPFQETRKMARNEVGAGDEIG